MVLEGGERGLFGGPWQRHKLPDSQGQTMNHALALDLSVGVGKCLSMNLEHGQMFVGVIVNPAKFTVSCTNCSFLGVKVTPLR